MKLRKAMCLLIIWIKIAADNDKVFIIKLLNFRKILTLPSLICTLKSGNKKEIPRGV